MSRQDASRGGPQLPQALLQQLGIDAQPSRRSHGGRKVGPTGSRKEQRKEERAQRGAGRAEKYQQRAAKVSERLPIEKPHSRPAKRFKGTVERSIPTLPQRQTSIKETTPVSTDTSSLDVSDADSRASSPGLVLDSTSRAFRDRAAQDEEEILALEKKLGVKTKKLPKSFDEDGLGDLLDGLDSGDEKKKRKREGEDWLERKRRKGPLQHKIEAEQEGDEMSDPEDDVFVDGVNDSSDPESNIPDDDDFANFSEDHEEPSAQVSRKRENPYIAPSTGSQVSTARYVPPSLRQSKESDTEASSRIRRHIQGQLNKLSEANLTSILDEIERMYRSNARQDITSTLIDLLLGLFSDRSSLQSTFVILHASFVAAIYRTIGIDFGAQFVAKLVERLDLYADVKYQNSSKESNNLISLLSYLFTFNVISSTLVFDYLRLYLESLNETNAELILRIVRDCGPQLRKDDPSSLKRIVQLMQNASSAIAADGREMSVRTKFMIETITDLKNNKMRAPTDSAGVASEHITRMRKVLGSLNNRNMKGSEPLQISKEDIQNGDQKGRWWLIGASWKGTDGGDASSMQQDHGHTSTTAEDVDAEDVDLWELARQYKMNTDIRRSIFVTIMSAIDYQDAHMRLLKLRLKRSQEQEVPKVLLRCAGAEPTYNPYYTVLAKKLCSDKTMKMAFQFSIWNFFKKLGENENGKDVDSESEDTEADVELREIVTLAKMYADLVLDGALSIGFLKVLNLPLLKEQGKNFVEVMLVTMFTGSFGKKPPREKTLVEVFNKVADVPQLVKPLQYLIKKEVRKSDLVAKKDREVLKRGCGIAIDTLAKMETSSMALA